MSAQQQLGLASTISNSQLMTTSLPHSLSRLLRTACYLLGAMAAILMAPRVVAQQPAFLTNGLVAYYPFNGNANDESGNNNNGFPNTALLAKDRFGRGDASYYFNGLNSCIQVGDSDDLICAPEHSVLYPELLSLTARTKRDIPTYPDLSRDILARIMISRDIQGYPKSKKVIPCYPRDIPEGISWDILAYP